MSSLTDTICMKRWQAYVLLAMTGLAMGFAVGQTASAIGF